MNGATSMTFSSTTEGQLCSNSVHCSRISQPVGIDKLCLWFSTEPCGWFTRDIPYFGANLHIMGRGRRAGVEFNPSRIIDPFGSDLASVKDTVNTTRAVWSVVVGHVVPVLDLASARVTRVDVARDFVGAVEPARLILGLSRLSRTYQGDPAVRFDARSGEVVSLTVGSAENRVRLYRKDVESAGLVVDGTIRWEAQVRSRPLRTKFGITSFSDITSESVSALANSRWAWSNMETLVQTTRDIFDIVSALEGTDAIKARSYWDLERLARYGLWPRSYGSKKRLRQLISDHGIVISPGCISLPNSPTLVERMDWATGMVVTTLGNANSEGPPAYSSTESSVDV